MERTARFVDDIRRFPVDRVAQCVTSPGPKWCKPAEKPKPPTRAKVKVPTVRNRGNKTTKQLLARLSYEQKRELTLMRRLLPRSFGSMARNHGYMKAMLGDYMRPHHQRAVEQMKIELLAKLAET